ncbi:MAG TPA: NAD(P) transhydrogenase subunit alpha [Gemmatimonadaceae bacterium]|nr:NAD(P) transhydrogenase subunit alpha [Gemmatimonadaceae bacterium]
MLEGLLVGLYVFVLAMLLGSEVITKVPQMLHTPLMSGSNAISGITLVGAVLIAGRLESQLSTIIGIAAVAFATINVVGGFLVTDRMLQMFRRGPARSAPAPDSDRSRT